MWKIALAVTAAAVLLTGCGGEPATTAAAADYPVYDSVAALYDRATLVVEGVAGPGRAAEYEGLPATVYEVTVARVWKGPAARGDVVEVKRVPHEPEQLADGRSYLLFLETYDGVPASTLNPGQGQYAIEDDAYVSLPGNALTVTAAELGRLR